MIWYEASLNAGLIDKVEVIKYTTINIWVKKGYMHVKQFKRLGQYTSFFPTFMEARTACMEHQARLFDDAKLRMEYAREKINRLFVLDESKLDDPPAYDTPLLITKEMI